MAAHVSLNCALITWHRDEYRLSYMCSLICIIDAWCCIILPLISISAGTLGFYLNGVAYPNGSTVLRTDIGEGANALQCTTNSTTCCRSTGGETRAGEFYMPNGSLILLQGTTTSGYYRTRGSGHNLLNRRSPGTITGRFRCNIPQANRPPDADLYINIGEYINYFSIHSCMYLYVRLTFQSTVDILVTITPSQTGDNFAGVGYSLMCYTRTELTGLPIITWLDPMGNQIKTTIGSRSTLTFNALVASDAGTYTCRTTLGSVVETAEVVVTVQSKCSVIASCDRCTLNWRF